MFNWYPLGGLLFSEGNTEMELGQKGGEGGGWLREEEGGKIAAGM